jgi:2-dehydro-3-deoxygluconokinase
LRPGQVGWDALFGRDGVRWFHTGGIFTTPSPNTPQVVAEAMQSAHRHGTVVSYDLNCRPSLWKDIGGPAAAQQVNRSLAPIVDVMIGNEEDFTDCLGFDVPGIDDSLTDLEIVRFEAMTAEVSRTFPRIKVVGTTLRSVRSASSDDWGAVGWSRDAGLVAAPQRSGLEILDRVDGDDSFASGLIYGLLTGADLESSVGYGAAHCTLAMTTPATPRRPLPPRCSDWPAAEVPPGPAMTEQHPLSVTSP